MSRERKRFFSDSPLFCVFSKSGFRSFQSATENLIFEQSFIFFLHIVSYFIVSVSHNIPPNRTFVNWGMACKKLISEKGFHCALQAESNVPQALGVSISCRQGIFYQSLDFRGLSVHASLPRNPGCIGSCQIIVLCSSSRRHMITQPTRLPPKRHNRIIRMYHNEAYIQNMSMRRLSRAALLSYSFKSVKEYG